MARGVLRVGATPAGEKLARKVDALNRLLHNDTGDIELNGERWLLERLGPSRPAVVLDVGANRGEWTEQVLRDCPSAHVHAFEPVPATYALLEGRFAANGRVDTHNVALTEPGIDTLRMWVEHETGSMSSATAAPRPNSAEVRVPCLTGDQFLAQHELSHVDLLKIDVEGHEMQVLDGFAAALGAGVIDVVQFEFTLWAAIARRWLADYYEVFEGHGYAVGKLLPRRVEWKDYEPVDEQFLRCNFVAALPGTPAADALGCRRPS
jgi:FkbM family methyltransferase